MGVVLGMGVPLLGVPGISLEKQRRPLCYLFRSAKSMEYVSNHIQTKQPDPDVSNLTFSSAMNHMFLFDMSLGDVWLGLSTSG